MSDKKAVKTFLWGTLAGAITGAVTALLFAPKPGKELRGDIANTAHKVGEKTADLGRQASTAVQSIARKTSDLVTDIRSRAKGESAQTETAATAEEEQDREDDSSSM